METHRLHAELLEREVRILVVGCGGNGSAILAGLPYLHNSMLAQGHPYGLHVTVMDGDTVSLFNSVRQPFATSEIGLNKAIVLVNRINIFWGLNWQAIPQALAPQTLAPSYAGYSEQHLRPDVVIGCVDTRAARAIIATAVSESSLVHYWLDLGNGASSGQFVMGEPQNARNKRSRTRLRTVAELYPEVIDLALRDDNEPSCSTIEALERQHSFVNGTLAQHALALVARLFRYGQISHHGCFVDVANSRCVPLLVDPVLWRRVVRRRGRTRTAHNTGASPDYQRRVAPKPSIPWSGPPPALHLAKLGTVRAQKAGPTDSEVLRCPRIPPPSRKISAKRLGSDGYVSK